MADRDEDYYDYALDPETWPPFMRVGLTPVPPSGQVWPDAAASAAAVNAPDAGMPAGLLWPMMPAPPQQAPDALFMQSAMMPVPPSAPMFAPDISAPPSPQANDVNVGMDVLKSGGIGLAKAGINTLGMGGDAREGVRSAVDWAASKFTTPTLSDLITGNEPRRTGAGDLAVNVLTKVLPPHVAPLFMGPTSEQIQHGVESVTGEFYKPQTTAGEVAQTAGEFAGALLGNRAGVLRRGAQWVGSTLGAEGAGRVADALDLPGLVPYARMFGGIVGGLLPSAVPSRAAPTPSRMNVSEEPTASPGGRPAPQMNVIEEMTGSSSPPEGRRTTVFSPSEAVPGESWGKFPGLREQPDPALFPERAAAARKAREDYSSDPRSSWADPATSVDRLTKTLGLEPLPMLDATGTFKANQPGATWQMNPAQVGRIEVDVLGTPKAPELRPDIQRRLNSAEATRGFVDQQDVSVHYWKNPDAPKQAQNSIVVPRDRKLNSSEFDDVTRIADEHGFHVADSGKGVALIDKDGRTGSELGTLLKGDLGTKLDKAFPGAPLEQAQIVSRLVPYEEMLKSAQQGDGIATRYLRDTLTRDPGLLNNPEFDRIIRGVARERLARDLERARQTGDPVGRANINALHRLAVGGPGGLFRALDRKEFLPAVLLALGIPALDQASAPPD